ncbi:MAG TPA: hypothetical protein VIY52_07625 [Streptosporangiaceae bacterium]
MSELGGPDPVSDQPAGRRVRLGSPRTWRIALGTLAVLSFAAAIPLSVLSDQVANGVIAAVIGVPSAAIGVLVGPAGLRRLVRHAARR